MLEITEKAKKYGVLSALLFDLKNTFKSVDKELNSFLEKLNIVYNTEKELFCLEVNDNANVQTYKEIHNPNVIYYSNYESTYLERIKESSNSLDKVYDYLVSLKEDFLINVREMAKEQFEERRIELQNSIDKDIRHSTVEQDVQENINTKRHRI
ncbi:hypothetical protein CAV_1099 [Campylobacter avium LMG 24591]|uniref:Uncharacterized protein n=1 Tax=Campylobacter avium LMG 24591 TaxID=522484 RepID=A0A222MYC4_9BACT|nr:hypothetical protein [Campylobacter avium]ASQ30738.1 hypothetical protein CAV_1099 [Campylobacter avium LMG 24591]OYD79834.1 hypothetical protein CAV8706_1098 [Campylobacter avium]